MKRITIRLIPVAILAPILLGGCAIPLAVTIATSVVELIITSTTGKQPTDHLLSAAMMRDCALFRFVQGKEICISDPNQALKEDPSELRLRVRQADGTVAIEPVLKVEPVHSYSEMPHDTNAGVVQDTILNATRSKQPVGIVTPVDDLPDIQ